MNNGSAQPMGGCGKPVDRMGKSGDTLSKASIWALLLVSGMGLFTPSVLTAEKESGVVISEVMWSGIEYVELFNASDTDIPLEGWQLVRYKTDTENIAGVVELGPDDRVAAGAYFIMERFVGGVTNSKATTLPESDTDMIITGSSLNLVDSGEYLELRDTDGALVDQVNQIGEWFVNVKGPSMERIDMAVSGTDPDNWQAFASEELVFGRLGTPRQENSVAHTAPSPTPSVSASPSPNSPTPAPQPVEVYINELLPDPAGSDAEGEFIELKNGGKEPVDLEGWQLDDEDGGSSPFVIPPGIVLQPGALYVFSRPETKIALNNTEDDVRLFSPEGALQSSISYDASSEGVSYARENDSLVYAETATPTPGKENQFTIPHTSNPSKEEDEEEDDEENIGQLSEAIVINEFLANPMGPDTELEFIELYNHGDTAVDLGGWQLDDVADGGSKSYVIPFGTVIDAGQFMIFDRPQTKIAINNSDEEVRLIDPVGTVKSFTSFTGTLSEEISWARMENGSYAATTTVTKGKKNIITSVDNSAVGGTVVGATTLSLSIEEARQLEVGTSVVVEGVVSAPPGVLGKTVAYLSGSGIQLYFSKAQWPGINLGDRIRVAGKISSVSGEQRINISKVEDIAVMQFEEAPEAHRATTGDIAEPLEGFLVEVSGRVTRSSGATFYIDDGSGEVRIIVQEATQIEKSRTTKGTFVRVIGVVSETRSGYRILPRFSDDLVVGAVASSAASSARRVVGVDTSSSVGDETTAALSSRTDVFEEGSVTRSIFNARNSSGIADAKKNMFVVFGVGAALTQVVGAVGAGEPLLRRARLDTKG
ncbi:MAG: lamin tail domain-containing protein [Candidatus Andersenbacteria bacterium]